MSSPTTTTTPQGGTVRGTGFTAAGQQPEQRGPERRPARRLAKQQNTTETTTTTEDTSIPEKIFLYGDIAGRPR